MHAYMVSSGAEALISELLEQLVIKQPADPASFLAELLATPGPRTTGGAVVAAAGTHEWSMVQWLGSARQLPLNPPPCWTIPSADCSLTSADCSLTGRIACAARAPGHRSRASA